MSEEKIYTSMYSKNAELYHHGIKGQKWGVENGPPYPLSNAVSTGKRLKSVAPDGRHYTDDKDLADLHPKEYVYDANMFKKANKKIEKLQKKSEQNRGYMKKHEDYYKNKTDRELEMKKNDRDKKIEKANKEFEKEASKIEKHNERQLKNDKGQKKAKEDAIKAEIKMKKLLAKENGGKYHYKDMTDEEKAYYKKTATKKITNALFTTMSLLYTANEIGLIEAPRPNEIKEYSSMKKAERNVDKAYKKFDKSVKNESYYTNSKTRERVNADVDKAINEREKKQKEFRDKHYHRK